MVAKRTKRLIFVNAHADAHAHLETPMWRINKNTLSAIDEILRKHDQKTRKYHIIAGRRKYQTDEGNS